MPRARLGPLPVRPSRGCGCGQPPTAAGPPLGSKVSVSPSPPSPAVLLSIPGGPVPLPSPGVTGASPWQGLGLELSLHPLTALCGAPGLWGAALPGLAWLVVTALGTRC